MSAVTMIKCDRCGEVSANGNPSPVSQFYFHLNGNRPLKKEYMDLCSVCLAEATEILVQFVGVEEKQSGTTHEMVVEKPKRKRKQKSESVPDIQGHSDVEPAVTEQEPELEYETGDIIIWSHPDIADVISGVVTDWNPMADELEILDIDGDIRSSLSKDFVTLRACVRFPPTYSRTQAVKDYTEECAMRGAKASWAYVVSAIMARLKASNGSAAHDADGRIIVTKDMMSDAVFLALGG